MKSGYLRSDLLISVHSHPVILRWYECFSYANHFLTKSSVVHVNNYLIALRLLGYLFGHCLFKRMDQDT